MYIFIFVLIILSLVIVCSREKNIFQLNPQMNIQHIKDDLYVVNNFYKYPDKIRNYALKQEFKDHLSIYTTKHINPKLQKNTQLRKFFSFLLHMHITQDEWKHGSMHNSNGYIQYMTENSNPIMHTDTDEKTLNISGVVYLSQNVEPHSGTSFYKHKETGCEKLPTDEEFKKLPHSPEHYEQTSYWKEGEPPKFEKWELVYNAENKYNRAIIFDAKRFHCADRGFGKIKENARMYQTFFV